MVRYGYALIYAAFFLAPRIVLAGVTFTGTVTPGTPADVDGSTQVVIGPDHNDEGTADPRGEIVVDQGSTFLANRILVGATDSALAKMRVSGPGTVVQLGGSNPAITLGQGGSSYLRIEDGAWVDIGSSQGGSLEIFPGSSALPVPSPAHVEVDGAGSLLTVGRQIVMDQGLDSRLSITNGGVVRVGSIGNQTQIRGLIEVVGERSEFQTNLLRLGELHFFSDEYPIGELHIRDGGMVRPYQHNFELVEVGRGSRILLDGGTFALPIEELYGTLQGSGVVSEDVNFSGQVLVGDGERLEFRGSLVGDGSVRVEEGALEIADRFELTTSGEFLGSATFIRSDVSLLRGFHSVGVVQVTDSEFRTGNNLGIDDATNQIMGEFIAEKSRVEWNNHSTSYGRIEATETDFVIGRFSELSNEGGASLVLQNSTVGSGNSQCCRGRMFNNGTIEVFGTRNQIDVEVRGGGSLLVREGSKVDLLFGDFQDITIAAGGKILSEETLTTSDLTIVISSYNLEEAAIDALTPYDDSQDSLFVLNGRLFVDAEELPNVELNDEFLLVEADQLFGDFSEYDLPELPGTLEFLPQLTDTTLSLLVIDTTETLPGDFNADGAVDAADFTLWRDGDLPGGSRWLDHALWQNNYGRTLASPANAVPEPTALAIVLTALAVGCGRRRAA